MPTAAAPNSVLDIADHGLIWQNGDNILELITNENIPEDINNGNSAGKADFVSTVLLVPRFDDNGTAERNIRPAERNYHDIESNNQTN